MNTSVRRRDQSLPWQTAFDHMLTRIQQTGESTRSGFPHFAETEKGVWTLSEQGDWTGGFWNGMLWLAFHATGDERFHRWAQQWTEWLRPRASSDTVFRGFLFYYGAALGAILAGDTMARDVALEGARGLATLFNPAAKLIPLGGAAEEASHIGTGEANIDGMQGSALLAWAAENGGEASLARIAADHAARSIEVFVRPDHSVVQSASLDTCSGAILRKYTHKGIRDDSTWTRAQAWALLGATVDAIWLPELRPLLVNEACRLADWWTDHAPPDHVAYWDFDAPRTSDSPRDTSGTGIAAAAMLKLSALCDTPELQLRYRSAAEETIAALTSRYVTPIGAADRRPPGMLTAGCYNSRIGLATNHELIWGSYYLFESLLVLNGALPAAQI